MAKRYPLPPETYEAVMARDMWCQAHAYGFGSVKACSGNLIVHHMKVKGMGGSADPAINEPENLVVLCGGVTGRDGHHGEVHDNPARSYECGLLIRHNN